MRSARLLFPLLLAVSFVFAQETVSTSALKPPETAIHEVTDTFFGTPIKDPYRWLEELKSPEVQTWMKSQNDYTRGLLDRIAGRDKLRARIAELDNTGVRVSSFQSYGGRVFFLKQVPGDDNRKLYVREGAKPERLLLNTEALTANGVHYSIDYYQPSPNGKLVAVGISPGGSENSVLHVLDVDTGKDTGERIDRAQFGSVAWLPDGRSFFYNRLQKMAAEAPRSDLYLNSREYLHHLSQDPDKDLPVLGKGLSQQVSMTETDIPFILLAQRSKYVLGVIAHGVQNELTVFSAPLKTVGEKTSWHKIADVEDEITGGDIHGDSLYLLTHHHASRFKVLQVHLPDGDVQSAKTVVEPSEAVITGISAAADALYIQKLDGGLGRLWRMPFEGSAANIALPFDGAIQELFASSAEPGAYVRVASWTKSPLMLHYDPEKNQLADTKIVPPSPADFSAITSEEVKVKAADGVLVPLSIVHKKDLKLDGSHPALLHGYGSYGITYDPSFDPTTLAWLERGGVIAVAHVRGGGEYGEDWHNAGRKTTKKNTFLDLIACAHYLVDQKFTSPEHLAGEGTSAGGITIGGAITERPDLFGAALDNVGDSDELRTELMVSGPANIPEFGSVKTEEGFKSLLAISSYHRVKDGTAYPAVLLTTGANDPRVDPWQMSKMAARLQAATSSGKPVLLRVDYDGGHGGIGATRSQHTALLTDQYSFLLWQFGDPEFQLKNAPELKQASQNH
jgi:prolyl oligopeptidase